MAPGRWLMVVTVAFCGAGCDLPRDPNGTLERVQGGRLRVGLVEAPPWVVRASSEPAGAEVELVRRFAAELGTSREWSWGGEERHMEALEHYQLDLVVGGLTDDTPWSKRVGLTGSYFKDRIIVGVPASTPTNDLHGTHVRVKEGDVVAAYLQKKGAIPDPVRNLKQGGGPAAAPDWQLEQLGLRPTGIELQSRKHVMAVPPGENGWLKRLEEFLEGQRDQVAGLLQREAARP